MRGPSARNSGHTPDHRYGRTTIVSHCPECPSYPHERHGMTAVDPKAKKATCRYGHKWAVRSTL